MVPKQVYLDAERRSLELEEMVKNSIPKKVIEDSGKRSIDARRFVSGSAGKSSRDKRSGKDRKQSE